MDIYFGHTRYIDLGFCYCLVDYEISDCVLKTGYNTSVSEKIELDQGLLFDVFAGLAILEETVGVCPELKVLECCGVFIGQCKGL